MNSTLDIVYEIDTINLRNKSSCESAWQQKITKDNSQITPPVTYSGVLVILYFQMAEKPQNNEDPAK